MGSLGTQGNLRDLKRSWGSLRGVERSQEVLLYLSVQCSLEIYLDESNI